MKILRFIDKDGEIGFADYCESGAFQRLTGSIEMGFIQTGEIVTPEAILAPIAPPAIYGIGLNYRKHAAESGLPEPEQPIVFFKAPSAVTAPESSILLPRFLRSDAVDYECELAIVIGKTCKNVSPKDAYDFVLGYTAANDVSARDWQVQKDKGGGQWSRGKTFDTFCPLGPYIVTPDKIGNPDNLAIRTLLNGKQVQSSNTADMIFSIGEIVAFLSGSTTLLPGTVILTGTPEGVGMAAKPPRWLREGDEVVIEIENIGSLSNTVKVETLT